MYPWDFGPLGTAITPLQKGGFPTFATPLNSFINIIHSTENKAIKESTTSAKFELKIFSCGFYFMVIYILLIRSVCMKS